MEDLRVEVKDKDLAEAIAHDHRAAAISPRQHAILEYAEKLTRTPAAMGQADVDRLRDHGLSDLEIHDAAQVCAYFNYINRIADGLGVDPEREMSREPDKR